MDKTFKVGDKVRFKTLEKIKEAATTVEETFINGELNDFCYEFSSGYNFVKGMEHLCGVEAYVSDTYDDAIRLNRYCPYNRDNDYDWVYSTEMVELVEDKPKSEQKSEQKSSESLDELKDKLENLKPKRKAVDIEIKCLKKMYNDYVKDYEEACNDFREFSEYAEECLEGMKKSILEAEKEVADNESLK